MPLDTFLKTLYSRYRGRTPKASLAPMPEMMRKLDNPEKTFPSIHIAGTNGKGSVAAKLSACYRKAGYKVALFTSPHLFHYSERFQINGEPIKEERLVPLLEKVLDLFPEGNFFELTTALAFLYFAEEKVDLAIIEAGLGGRYDATNVLTPLLSIVTSVGLEHRDVLGSTLAEIAEQKLGILKDGVPFVLGPSVPSSLPKIEGRFLTFEEENRAIAKRAVEILSSKFRADLPSLDATAPCRLQEIEPGLFLDVAHNPPALESCFATLAKRLSFKTLYVNFSLAEGKDPSACLEVIPKECILTSSYSERPLLVVGSFHHMQKFLNSKGIDNLLSISPTQRI